MDSARFRSIQYIFENAYVHMCFYEWKREHNLWLKMISSFIMTEKNIADCLALTNRTRLLTSHWNQNPPQVPKQRKTSQGAKSQATTFTKTQNY